MWKPGYRMLTLVVAITVVSGIIIWIVAAQMDMMPGKNQEEGRENTQQEVSGITTANAEDVFEIELNSPQGNSLLLRNESGTWTMNGEAVPQDRIDGYFQTLSNTTVSAATPTEVPTEEPSHTATYRLRNGDPSFVNFWNKDGKWTIQTSASGDKAFTTDSDEWVKATMADSNYFQDEIADNY